MVNDLEARVQACYSTWSGTYYDEYYGPQAGYPPVHRELMRRLLRESGARTVLDAGCGPASFLRDLAGDGFDRYGFDLTPEMVVEARRVLGRQGVPADHVWQGSVLEAEAYRAPDRRGAFDAAVCVGVLPHIPAEADGTVLRNLLAAVRPGGTVIVEARNQLFALFTLNRYSHKFFLEELIRADALRTKANGSGGQLDLALDTLRARFRLDLPPMRKGKADEPGYDEVLSRTHNPLVLRQQMVDAGFVNVRVLFYHFHCLPPMTAGLAPELFHRESLAMEDPEDWRGHFMASAFLLCGSRA